MLLLSYASFNKQNKTDKLDNVIDEKINNKRNKLCVIKLALTTATRSMSIDDV